jgi:CheY-like chemotaxis protein
MQRNHSYVDDPASLPAALVSASLPPRDDVDSVEAVSESDIRVLVVEENVGSAEFIGSLLRRMGYAVCVARDGSEASSLALRFRPDVILSNLDLPDRDGCELALELREDPAFRHTALIALSDHGSPAERERARSVGFETQLVKPLSPRLLKSALDNAMQPAL